MKRSKDHSTRNLLILSASVVALILLVAMSATYFQAKELADHRLAVIRTQQLITLMARLESGMYRVESQQRGYLITGRKRYLEPFSQSKEHIDNLLGAIESMFTEGSIQASRLREMRLHSNLKLGELEKTIALRKRGHYEDARQLVLTGQGQKEMDSFLSLLRAMKKEENRVLRIQTRRLESSAAETVNRLITLAIVSLLAFLIGLHHINRMESNRRQTRLTHEALFEVSTILAKSDGLSTLLTGILELVCLQFGWKAGIYWRETREMDVLTCAEFYSTEPLKDFEKEVYDIKVQRGEGLSGMVWTEGKPLWSKAMRLEGNGLVAKSASKVGLHGAFAFPIKLGDEFTGIFEFYSDRIEKPDMEMLDAFALVGAEIGQLVERRKIEDRLEESLDELAQAKGVLDSVLDNMGSGVVFAGSQGEMQIFNKAAERILGRGSREMKLEDWLKILYNADDDTLVTYEDLPLLKAVNGESTNDVLLVVKNEANPTGIVLSINGRPVKNDFGDIIGGVVVLEDITARHEAEKRVSEFYSTVSHELRTPLTAIKGSLGLLEGGKGGELSQRAMRLVSMGRRECDRLVRLINDILDIRKIEAGKLDLSRTVFDPSRLLSEVVETLSSNAREDKVKVEVSSAVDERVFADRDRINQVLTNLISNAIKFSYESGVVSVSTRSIDDRLRFTVTDEGPGISEQDKNKLFRKFQQLNSSDSRPKGGTGLGLAICKALVEQHGGQIGLDSAPGKGSSFWFELPRHIEDRPRGNESIRANDAEKFVVLLESSDLIASRIIDVLNEEGVDFKQVSTESELKTLLEEQTPDVLIMDIEFQLEENPDLFDVVVNAREEFPVIVVTAENKARSFSMPLLIDWISKPFDKMRSKRSIKLALATKDRGPARVLIVEDDQATLSVIGEQIAGLGVHLEKATDGQSALSKARTSRPDLIILDVGLPDFDGFEVVANLRNDEDLKDIPTVVFTARDLSIEDRGKLSLGLTKYLTKTTTSEEEFIMSVKSLLNGLLQSDPGQEIDDV